MEEIIRNITSKQLKKEDLCIEDFSENYLYDYSTIEEFYESIVYDLNQETDIIEFDNACKSFIEQSKYIKVFKNFQQGLTMAVLKIILRNGITITLRVLILTMKLTLLKKQKYC